MVFTCLGLCDINLKYHIITTSFIMLMIINFMLCLSHLMIMANLVLNHYKHVLLKIINSDWMKSNFLKLNDATTEFILFGCCNQLSKITIPFINLGNSEITPVP